MLVMKPIIVIFAAALWLALPMMRASGASAPKQTAMIFLPPGADYCRDFLRLEPMQKYDKATSSIRKGEAEAYFTYRGIEEWLRGFVTASNLLNAKTGSNDATNGKDVYELMPQLFEYCRAHRDDIFSDAALSLLISKAPTK